MADVEALRPAGESGAGPLHQPLSVNGRVSGKSFPVGFSPPPRRSRADHDASTDAVADGRAPTQCGRWRVEAGSGRGAGHGRRDRAGGPAAAGEGLGYGVDQVSTSEASPDALRRALAALRDMKERVERVERAAHEPIAIIGAGCRLPGGVDSPDAYWELLRAGRRRGRTDPSRAVGRRRLLRPRPGGARHHVHRPGRVRALAGRSLRRRVLRHLAARGQPARSAATAAPRGRVGGAGARRHGARRPGRLVDRRLRGHGHERLRQPADARWRRRGHRRVLRHGRGLLRGGGADLLPARAARADAHARHRVLLVPGGHRPRGAVAASRGLPHRHRRRRQPHAGAPDDDLPVQAPSPLADRPLPHVQRGG